MDYTARCRAMAAFCRQRALMDNEDESFWLTEAEVWARRLEIRSISATKAKPVIIVKRRKISRRTDRAGAPAAT